MSAALAVQPESVTIQQIHAGVIEAAENGTFTIIDLFDCLPWFRTGADWGAWRVFLKALYGLPMDRKEQAIYLECTGRVKLPEEPATEAWLAVGRRGRKSAIAALIGLWNAAYRMDYGGNDAHEALIAPGETPTVPILSKDKYTAGQIRDYLKAMLGFSWDQNGVEADANDSPLAYLLAGRPTGDVVPLLVPGRKTSYRVDIIVRAATITGGRSRTVLGALLDEVAFFRSEESANPDKEIIRGLKPGMSTIPGALLLGLSSPYARRGVLWEKYQDHYGKPGSVLFWKAPTLTMHDTPQVRQVVADAYDEDSVSAKAEYGAEFRTDVEVYVNHEVVNAATVQGRFQLAPVQGVTYFAFVDPAGGTGDDFTLAVSHWDGASAVLDLLWEKAPPFDPGDVVAEAAEILKPYWIRRITGDHWGGEWPTAMFRKAGMAYYANADTKSDIYKEFLPVLNSGACQLLDVKKLRQQLVGLDRRTARGGRDSIDHLVGAHDDVANAAAGALLMAYRAGRKPVEVRPEATTTDEIVARKIHDSVFPTKRPVTNPYSAWRSKR